MDAPRHFPDGDVPDCIRGEQMFSVGVKSDRVPVGFEVSVLLPTAA